MALKYQSNAKMTHHDNDCKICNFLCIKLKKNRPKKQ